MTLFPDVQRRAQEEIDRVVGSKRLPEFSDQENLPYITAIVKEILRWAPPFPLGEHPVYSFDSSTFVNVAYDVRSHTRTVMAIMQAFRIRLLRQTSITGTTFRKGPCFSRTLGRLPS